MAAGWQGHCSPAAAAHGACPLLPAAHKGKHLEAAGLCRTCLLLGTASTSRAVPPNIHKTIRKKDITNKVLRAILVVLYISLCYGLEGFHTFPSCKPWCILTIVRSCKAVQTADS